MDASDILQEPVSHACSFVGSFDEACDVPYFNLCWRHLLWLRDFDQVLDSPIVNSHLGHVWFNGAEGIVACLSLLGLRQCVEKGGLTNVWIAYYATGSLRYRSGLETEKRLAE